MLPHVTNSKLQYKLKFNFQKGMTAIINYKIRFHCDDQSINEQIKTRRLPFYGSGRWLQLG